MGSPGQDEFQDFWGYVLRPTGPTFDWATGARSEPNFRKAGGNSSEYTIESPTFTYTLDGKVDKLYFPPGAVARGILVMIKDGESVTDNWNGTAVRPHVTFTLPANSIVFKQTTGSFMYAGNVDYYPTCQKTITDGTHTVELPYGTADEAIDDGFRLFETAGFNVQRFPFGIDISLLDSMGRRSVSSSC